ncbi:MAG: glucosyltransferase domain-containing protein [Acetatifactor sp.]|nr:glucosyltransferase domain-containing protein [Acetatifactor sp.]
MKNPTETWNCIRKHCKREWKLAFFSSFLLGILIHMPIMLRDIPNHDGLASMYFDQNMITSGRWFLTVACGISSYYTLPWLIGLLAMLYLGITSALLTEFLEVRQSWAVVLIGGLLVAFPSLASTFAYVFTMDGYMLAVLLAVLAVLLTKKYRLGFLPGALCLACSLGIYQSYLPFAVLLCLYGVFMIAASEGELQEKGKKILRYVYMGGIGMAAYYGILRLLLLIQGKELASYQGIDGMGSAPWARIGSTVAQMYRDFLAFTLKGNVFVNNLFSWGAMIVLGVSSAVVLVCLCLKKKWWKSVWFFVIIAVTAVGLPIAMNLILIISPDVTYHLLMRYQWVLLPVCMVAAVSKYSEKMPWAAWLGLVCGLVLLFNYGVTDQIAYSNLEKKYEKTYAYCVRLLDRIEQTPGYYQGIPIAMIGVVGDHSYPVTDLTEDVTAGMIGIGGDSLLYTGANYQAFIQNYLGATLNILPPKAMEEMYYSEAYREMESFPGADSIRIIDGVLYIKTENRE